MERLEDVKMAMADYMPCSTCGKKLIYDADWYHRTAGIVLEGICRECQSSGCQVIVVQNGRATTGRPRDHEGYIADGTEGQ